jgi:hypothetical protein
MLLLLAALGA